MASVSVSSLSETGSTPTDRKALAALFNATNGRSWEHSQGWCTTAKLKHWYGVTVDEQGRVVELRLPNNKMKGVLPPELGLLHELRTLAVHDNELEGNIPSELGFHRRFETLLLHNNKFNGTIPAAIGWMDWLTSVTLGGNMFGEVSLEFLKVARLRKMAIPALGLDKNPLLRPPQLVMAMGFDQAISWGEDIERFGEGTSNKLKMVLVGLAEAGKTTVVRNITGRPVPKPMDRTVGIEITDDWKPFNGDPLEISIWDFAGQADYYASHQIFLTKGAVFLLVVDLRTLFVESTNAVEKHGDPNGHVFRWLEMLHLRVPGAAVAVVGTHSDAAEFDEPGKLEAAVTLVETLISRYKEDKAEEASNIRATHHSAPAPEPSKGGKKRVVLADSLVKSLTATPPPIIHGKVFRTSLNSESSRELVAWIRSAATKLDCPEGFNFPAVGAKIPTAWIDANSAMDGLRAGKSGKRYVTWREAVKTFGAFMAAKGTPIPDLEEILLRAMRHREAEGGVLLSLEGGSTQAMGSAGMLYLDPTWLIELIRRLTDHNLKDPTNQGRLKDDLEKYGKEQVPPLGLDKLYEQHRAYLTSGTLDEVYLRFLWLHRQLDTNETKLSLNPDEFNCVLATMVALLVLYKVPAAKAGSPAQYVAPVRLPEYGDAQVLEKANIGLGDFVVRARCEFRRSYPPPAIIGRFLAFSNAHIMEARECWQHGAHVIWTPGAHDVLVYESRTVERRGDDSVTYPGLVLCVKGTSPAVREILATLTEQVKRLFKDKVHGYPGLCSVVFESTDKVSASALNSDLRKYLDNRFDRLDTLVSKVAGETSQVLQGMYLAGEKENQYPRLVFLKPETDPQPDVEIGSSPIVGSPPMVADATKKATSGLAAAEGMQRKRWDEWIQALKARKKMRMVFLCEHDMTEVECGPDGKGYLVKDLPKWFKALLPLLKVSMICLRLAVGAVSHVDLPCNQYLAALVNSVSTELLGAMGTSIPISDLTTAASSLLEESAEGELQPPPKALQEKGYLAACQFMQTMENPPTTCCISRFRCTTCGSTRHKDCFCISWRDVMVRVPNGKGGVAWVKKANMAAYVEKIKLEAEIAANVPLA